LLLLCRFKTNARRNEQQGHGGFIVLMVGIATAILFSTPFHQVGVDKLDFRNQRFGRINFAAHVSSSP
jgi:hypothetical protein